MSPCAAKELPRPLSPRRRSAVHEIEVSPIEIMTCCSEIVQIHGKEEALVVVEQTHDNHQLSCITRSEEDDDSLALFDPVDLSRETWASIIYERIDPPLVPLAVIAAATILFHPLLFVAGAASAATAVGAVHMIGHGYSYMCGNDENEIVENEENMPPKPTEIASFSKMPTCIPSNPTYDTLTSQEEKEDLFSINGVWLSAQFPTLTDSVAEHVHFVGLNALEFFKVFLDDDAPYTFKEFQKQRGDIDIDYGLWEPLSSLHQLSMHPQVPSSDIPEHAFSSYERTLSFKTLTKSFFGPPYATASKKQRIHMTKKWMILESRVELQNIPFCKTFFVLERWILHSPKVEGKRKVSVLNVHSQVFFRQHCTFEAQIRSKSLSTLKDIVTCWCQMAQQVLEITIKHKLERERQEEKFHEQEEDSIEVTHSHSCRLIVLGDENTPPPTPNFPPMVVLKKEQRTASVKSFKRTVLQRMVRKSSLQ